MPVPSAAQILADLIRCPSVTPDEAGALDYLERLLGEAGFACERPVFAGPGSGPVENFFATRGASGPHLMFAGHVDVVPPGDAAAWTHPPFSAAVEDGVLYGRGAVDMKGGIACFLAALFGRLAEGPLAGRVSLVVTCDEEGPGVNGTARLLEWAAARGHRFDAAVVGEPTSAVRLGDTVKVGRRGSLSGTVTVTGRQGHSAYPQKADNPVPRLVRLLAALIAAPLDEGTDRFEPSNLQLTSIDVGNPAFNVIPGEAGARFNVRFNDRWTHASLVAELRRRMDTTGEPYRLELRPFNSPVFLTRAESLIGPLAAAIRAVTGAEPELATGGGTSDARFVKDYCPVVEFGLVGDTMHQVDERVRLADLETLTRIYRGFLDRYFAAAS